VNPWLKLIGHIIKVVWYYLVLLTFFGIRWFGGLTSALPFPFGWILAMGGCILAAAVILAVGGCILAAAGFS
jgi:hypothetical protein